MLREALTDVKTRYLIIKMLSCHVEISVISVKMYKYKRLFQTHNYMLLDLLPLVRWDDVTLDVSKKLPLHIHIVFFCYQQ